MRDELLHFAALLFDLGPAQAFRCWCEFGLVLCPARLLFGYWSLELLFSLLVLLVSLLERGLDGAGLLHTLLFLWAVECPVLPVASVADVTMFVADVKVEFGHFAADNAGPPPVLPLLFLFTGCLEIGNGRGCTHLWVRW